MKKCEKCGELNGDNRGTCFACGAVLPPPQTLQVCPKCKIVYRHTTKVCEDCGGPLEPYHGERYITAGTDYGTPKQSVQVARDPNAPSTGLYVLSALIPIVGLALGLTYIARRDDDYGKEMIVLAVVGAVAWAALSFLVFWVL